VTLQHTARGRVATLPRHGWFM